MEFVTDIRWVGSFKVTEFTYDSKHIGFGANSGAISSGALEQASFHRVKGSHKAP